MRNRTAILYGKALLALDVSIELIKLVEAANLITRPDAVSLAVAVGALSKALQASDTAGVDEETLRIYRAILVLLESEQAAYLALALDDVATFKEYLASIQEDLELIIVATRHLKVRA